MPMYDYLGECGCRVIDVLEPITVPARFCAEHGVLMKRAWLTRVPAVIPDSIPGGVEIRNGLCNPDGTPRRYDSKSEIRREAKQRKLQNVTEHIGDAERGSDKAPSVGRGRTTTSRWY